MDSGDDAGCMASIGDGRRGNGDATKSQEGWSNLGATLVELLGTEAKAVVDELQQDCTKVEERCRMLPAESA